MRYAIFSLACLVGLTLHAADKVWEGNDTGNVGDYSVAANWQPSGVPGAADNVSIPAGSASITAGLGQSGVAIGSFRVEAGYTGTIGVAPVAGAAAQYLDIDPDSFYFEGASTVAYIDLSIAAGNVDAEVFNTGSPATGKSALYLKGGTIRTLTVRSGSVGIARILGEAMTITTLESAGTGAVVNVGTGATLTTIDCRQGTIATKSGATNLNIYNGSATTEGTGAFTTVDLNAGTGVFNSTGTITTLTVDGGTADFLQSGLGRTVSTLTQQAGAVWYDSGVLTITTDTAPGIPVKRTFTAP